jgi:broad specificity phosphatase PhoE
MERGATSGSSRDRNKLKITILLRHPESTKNVAERFSDPDNGEQVTAAGDSQISALVAALSLRLHEHKQSRARIVSANSVRALSLARELSERLYAPLAVSNTLVSIKSDRIAGKLEKQVAADFPAYYHALALYRSGVVSSYDLPHKGQPLRDYEGRVGEILTSLEEAHEEVGIVVAHRSALTAALILYARKYHNYPSNFFGYISLPLASVSIIAHTLKGGSILCVGLTIEQLDQIDRSLERYMSSDFF